MAAPKKKDPALTQEREEAWVGDAVLALYVREWILREKGEMDGEMFTRFTSNHFLKSKGNPTSVEAEIGRVYHGTVVKILEFGAFVNIFPGQDGLVHISQIAEERVQDVNDHLTEGQEVDVKVLEVDRQGRIKLSIKEVKSSD